MKKEDNKDKIRVYEYAKSLNMSSKEIITILKRLNKPVNNHMSVIEPEAIEGIENFFRNIKMNAAVKRANETTAAPASAQAQAKPQASNPVTPKPQATGTDKAQIASPTVNSSTIKEQPRPAGNQGQERRYSSEQRPQGGDGRRNYPPSQGGNRPVSSGGANRPGQTGGNRPGVGGNPTNANRPTSSAGRPQSSGGGYQQAGAKRPVGQDRGPSQNRGFSSSTTPSSSFSAAPTPARNSNSNPNSFDRNRNAGAKKTKGSDKRFEDQYPSKNKPGRGNAKGKHRQQQEVRKEKVDNTPRKVIIRGTMTVGELAKVLHKDASEVIKKLMFLGVIATINQELDLDTIQLIVEEYKVEMELKIPVEEDNFETIEEQDDEAELEERPPVVTIMGHVDHGKTTLLDAIRQTKVTEGEAGGITQHIGAYQVEIKGKKITFLDTPGHEAFTTMRSRGAKVTDITILVVAADDGVMPQTVEAINHAKAANVPIIVAVNKIDKPTANPDKIKQELTEYGLVPEEWGGETIFANVSAKQRMGLEELLEMILLVAEVQEIKANPNKRARGTVLEAELDKGRGPVARVLIQHGTLRVGDAFIAGVCFGRVRTMVNDKGRRLKEAPPSTPLEITGLSEVPQAGDPFIVFEDERKARSIAERRSNTHRLSVLGENSKVTLDDLFKHIQEGQMKELNIIIKGDVHGSVEALKSSLEKIDVEGVRVKILHTGVGAITESDIILASASNAIVIGFNVRPEPLAKSTADQEKVDIRLHSIIYKVIEEIEQAMKGMLDPEYVEKVIGQVEIRNTFKISKVGTIAGCMVTSGKIVRNAEVRLIREGIVIHTGRIDSLKRFKDDAKEVSQGYECGLSLDKYNDIKEGDILEVFVMETVER